MLTETLQNSQEQKDIAKSLSSKSYPCRVTYHCKIHNRPETAEFIGIMGDETEEVGLYNTPEKHTLGYRTVMQLAEGTLPDETWRRYGWQG